jgi:PAS domain S-box-containing protein
MSSEQDRMDEILSRGAEQVESVAIVTLDVAGRISSWNTGAELLTGHTPTDAIGEGIGALLTQEPERLSPALLTEFAESGGEHGIWLLRKDGSRFWANLAAVAVDGADGADRSFAVFLRDATALKVARDELKRSTTMFEGILAIASDAVVCVDETQRIIFFNEGAERIFEYRPEEVLGEPLTILVPDRFRESHDGYVREFGEAPIVARQMGERGEISGKRRSGEVFPAEASISKLDVGSGRIYTAVLRDATERRAAQEALARQAEELARSNAELEQFAYVASHDLQEPLRMVASYTQLLARRYRGQLDDDAEEFIGFAVDGVTRMQALINDLLAYSRVGTRGGEFSQVPLEAVLQRVIASLGPSLEEAGATVTHDPLPTVRGDATQLSQLFQNLIQNGVKFCRKGVAPVLHVGVREEEAVWHLTVRDNGIGIPEEFQDRIFVIFQRLHSRAEYPGTGIGLSICKKIVERHGGRIWVESASGEGSTFHFTLPKDELEE